MGLKVTIQDFIREAKGLKVAVIGETIVDEFVYVSYEGQSMKSICPVFKFTGEKEVQQGGASAIAGHLRDFVKSVDLFTNTNQEIGKTRYVDVSDRKKHVELNKFDTAGFGPIALDASKYDVVIVADFGHSYCTQLDINGGFHLMCQTNSNNFGFNRISKWKNHKKKSVCIDLREASLQLNKKAKFNTTQEIEELYGYELNATDLFITLGSAGSLYYNGKETCRQPSYKSEVIDTIGAGDTFYAFACIASAIYSDKKEILTVPSLAASLSTTWLCNERSVNKTTLLEYADRFI